MRRVSVRKLAAVAALICWAVAAIEIWFTGPLSIKDWLVLGVPFAWGSRV